jgi:hypothetical protein
MDKKGIVIGSLIGIIIYLGMFYPIKFVHATDLWFQPYYAIQTFLVSLAGGNLLYFVGIKQIMEEDNRNEKFMRKLVFGKENNHR